MFGKHGFHGDGPAFWQKANPFLKVLLVVGGIAAMGGMVVLVGFIIMSLWNWLMPGIFNLPKIDFLQAWGLLILSSILFRHAPSGSNSSGDKRRRRMLKERMKECCETEESSETEPPKN